MIRLDQVGLHYGQNDPEVLTNISLVLEQGAFCWLLGPSGAGKTSLLRLMYLAALPTSGRMWLLDSDVGAADRETLVGLRRRIGVVFQDFRLLANLSTFDNVALPLRIAGRPEAQIQADVTEMLRWVGLRHKAAVPPRQLSGGEQQRVAIARAVISGPALLLADEPTGNLDDAQAERLMILLREMNKLGTTVVIATHNAGLAARHHGRVLRLADGRLVAPESAPVPPVEAFAHV
jgi:cell division transport system ATP-binding protein